LPLESGFALSVWMWIAIGVVSLIGFSLLAGFALARILGTVGREVSYLLESEAEGWATASLAHATREDVPVAEGEASFSSQARTVRSREHEFVTG
jgi:hypothetical protein